MWPRELNDQDFHLQQIKDTIEKDEFDDYPFLIFEQPLLISVVNDTYKYAVPVFSPFKDDHLFGYLALPRQYQTHWVDLCYQIVYHQNAYSTLRKAVEQLGDSEAKDVLSQNFSSVGAILKYLLYVWGMIIKVLLAAKGLVNPTLLRFKKFIIKNRFNYFWDSDKVLRSQDHIFKDPLSDDMKKSCVCPNSLLSNSLQLIQSEIALKKGQVIKGMQPPEDN